MSIMPEARGGSAMPPVLRTLIFWILMMLLAIVLWKLTSPSRPNAPTSQLSYSDFMKQVEAKNLQSAKFTLAETTANVYGQLKQPAESFETTVPADSTTNLMNSLRAAGVDVQVAQGTTATNAIVNVLPIMVLVGFWIYMVRRQAQRRAAVTANPNTPSPGALG
jgi:cell division protease FtsH